jgi:hypothetical protein
VAPPGNQAVNGENKPQPVVSGETGLLDSIDRVLSWELTILFGKFTYLTRYQGRRK